MSERLFREEVFAARRQGGLGTIFLAQPLSLWAITWLVVAVTALLLAFGVFGEFTRRHRVTGLLVPEAGLVGVVAPLSGTLSQLLPPEGDAVDAGAVLARIVAPRALGSGDDATHALLAGVAEREAGLTAQAEAQGLAFDAQLAAARVRAATLAEELPALREEIALRDRQLALADEVFERQQALLEQRYIGELTLRQQEQALIDLRSQRQALLRQEIGLRRELAQVRQQIAELGARREAEEAARRQSAAVIGQERLQLEAGGEQLIRAPLAGVLANRLVEPGQAVQAGQPLLELMPEGAALQARLLVPSRAIGFIQPGDRVLMRYQAFPYQKFGHQEGRVLRISHSPVPASEALPQVGAQPGETWYRVIVALDRQHVTAYGQPEALRPGMVLEADILGDRRRLYEWALEPLYSLRGRGG